MVARAAGRIFALALGLAFLGAVGAAPASGDVVWLDSPAGAERSRVMVQRPDGRVWRGPSVAIAGDPGLVAPAPDGRHVAVASDLEPGPLVVVPRDGGSPFSFAMPPGVEMAREYSTVSWTSDGRTVLVGDALRVDPEADRSDPLPATLRWTALRCTVAARSCVEVRGGGLVAPNGDGVLRASSPQSAFGQWLWSPAWSEERETDWTVADSPDGRELERIVGAQAVSEVELEGAPPCVVRRDERSGGEGLPLHVEAVGGPAGTLVVRQTIRLRRQARRDELRLRDASGPPRLMRVGPDGAVHLGPFPRARVGRVDLRALDGRGARTASRRFHPATAMPDGWLGTVGRTIAGQYGGFQALAVAAMDARGRLRVLRVDGRAATAERLLRHVRGGRATRLHADLSVIGYERATRSAVVALEWAPMARPGQPQRSARRTVLRVPLDGGRPRRANGRAQAAW